MSYSGISCVWLFLTVLPVISGCSFSKNDEDLPMVDYRQGQIMAEQSGNRERFNFKYEYDAISARYHIKLTAAFSPPLTVTCAHNQPESLQLDILGYKYQGEEAYAMLSSRIPDFPWEQLPELLNKGEIDSASWTITGWDRGKMKLTNEAGLIISWSEDKK